ncbi:DUF4231 domain-containing protein [Streptomyces sp. LaPpAH-108]|uniref:DUF4231 domain-containing protein n=1 Tax=Streptomyces sp. LaPpAH-108 TaxID=1155714 RepID=UPI0003A5CF6F|nr:DUF4231 domain-containing protein [Streptomyces sp. LaPpAH-108]
MPKDPAANSSGYALSLADGSYAWYRRAAIKARRFHRAAETLLLLVSAAIPVSAVVSPHDATTPAVLGGAVVVLTGLRALFHWHDDYVRFSQAREAVEAERRLYRTAAEPYADPATRDRLLAAAVTRIEQQEMGTWVQLVGTPRESTGDSTPDRSTPPT